MASPFTFGDVDDVRREVLGLKELILKIGLMQWRPHTLDLFVDGLCTRHLDDCDLLSGLMTADFVASLKTWRRLLLHPWVARLFRKAADLVDHHMAWEGLQQSSELAVAVRRLMLRAPSLEAVVFVLDLASSRVEAFSSKAVDSDRCVLATFDCLIGYLEDFPPAHIHNFFAMAHKSLTIVSDHTGSAHSVHPPLWLNVGAFVARLGQVCPGARFPRGASNE